jgi:hypothetical protein
MYFDQVLNYAGHTLQTMVTNNALFHQLAQLTKYKLFNITNIYVYDVINMIRSEDQEGLYSLEIRKF